MNYLNQAIDFRDAMMFNLRGIAVNLRCYELSEMFKPEV